MVLGTLQLEVLPAEIGEETVLDYNDDETVSSKILLSPGEKNSLIGKKDDYSIEEVTDENNAFVANDSAAVGKASTQGIPVNVQFHVSKDSEADSPEEEVEDADATSVEKEDTPQPPQPPQPPIERDFDKDPTVLYALVQKKLWKEAVDRAKIRPDEASIWVSRREKDGRLRWRLLPLHAAVVFKASEGVIETLLSANPMGAQSKDDQGMLPLHLAFRNGASEAVVNLLLVAHPQSVDIPDRKGRVPLTLARAAASPHREVFVRALEKGPSYYAIAAVAAARANIIAEQKAIYDAKLTQARQFHDYEVSDVRAEEETKRQMILSQVAELEKELARTQETSQVLADHVNGLEAQLNSRSDTERFLATKIANLDEKLKQTELITADNELGLKTENALLVLERDDLLVKIEELQTVLESTQEKLTRSLDMSEKKGSEWEKTKREVSDELHEAKVELANSHANAAILESQLKKRMENEHLLASQVSALASRLAECANDNRESNKSYTQLIKELEDDRVALKDKVQDLTTRLKYVAKVMEDMTEQQVKIVDDAITHEEMISKALEAHAKIVTDAIEQEKELDLAKEERRIMKQLLDSQERTVDNACQKRLEIMDAIAFQGKCMAGTREAREGMLTNVQELGMNMNGVLQTVMGAVAMEKPDPSASTTDNKSLVSWSISPEDTQDDIEKLAQAPTISRVSAIGISPPSPEMREVEARKNDMAVMAHATPGEAPAVVEARSDEDNTGDRSGGDADRIMAAREL